MTKLEFQSKLRQMLAERGLPDDEIARSLDFYLETIDDRMEEGMSEEEAVAALGNIKDIAEQILYDTPLGVLVKSKIKKGKEERGSSALLIVLAVIGFPVWFPLLIACFAIIFAMYVVIWSLIFSVFAVVVSIGIVGLAALPASLFLFAENYVAALGMIGTGLILAGLSILLYFPAKYAAKGLVRLTGLILKGIKSLFIGKSSREEQLI